MPSAAETDVVVLGGGSGGYAAALRAAELGQRVVLVEKHKIGGTCLHRGCIPTKALLHAGEIADQAREAAQFGIDVFLKGIDMAGVHAYMDRVVGKNFRGLANLIKSRGITVVPGQGRLVGPRSVAVDGRVFTGAKVVLATGSAPRLPPGFQLTGSKIIDSERALALDHVPTDAIILGGGVIGAEFASAWSSLGSTVTLVEAMPRLIPLEDEATSEELKRAFRRRGIEVRLSRTVDRVEETGSGVVVRLDNGEALTAALLLVAVGRRPASEGLGYEEHGVELDRGFVVVDEYCRTSAPDIYAVGDLIPTLQLAHVGFAEGILVADHIAGLPVVPIDYSGVPRVVYSSPEVASVGYTEAQAVERLGRSQVKVVTYDLAGNGRSAILGTRGFVKLVAEVEGPVLGVHLVGDRVSELIAEAQLIYNWEARADEVAALIHPHPTQSEALGEAHLLLAGRPLHVHG